MSLPNNPIESFRKRNPHIYGQPSSEGDQEMARDGVANELTLHVEIKDYCNAQFPRWKYISANPTVKSTIQTGVCDFTVFLPGGRTLCVECKNKTGKLDSNQLIWKKEMEMIGHTVHIVRSMEHFLQLVNTNQTNQTPK